MSTETPEFGHPSRAIPGFENDPDLGDVQLSDPADEASDLELIAAELAADTTPAETTVAVAGRPGWAVVLRTDFTHRDVDLLRRKSKDRKFTDGIDPVKFACLLIATNTIRFERRGVTVELGGQTATFATPAFQQLLGAAGAVGTVKQMWGNRDPRVIGVSERLLEEAGWGEEADLADPTD